MRLHRNKQIWGQDAYEFRPERWLEASEKSESPVGVYSNLCGMDFDPPPPADVLMSFDIAPLSPEVTGGALDGDSRKSLRLAFQFYAK